MSKVAIELIMDEFAADEIAKKGLAEIALRRTDAKFKEFVKARVLGDPVSGDSPIKHIAEVALDATENNSFNDGTSIRKALAEIKKSNNQLTKISSATKTISWQVDSLYQSANVIKQLSYLNTGLLLANTAIDIAGFVMVNQKLKELNGEMAQIAAGTEKLLHIEQNKITQSCQKLIMQYNSIMTKHQDGEDVTNDMEELLIDMRSYLSFVITNLYEETLGRDILLNVLFSMTPAYAILFSEFVKAYYFKKSKLIPNYDSFVGYFKELQGDKLRNTLEDYYYLTKKLYHYDAIDAVDAQVFIAFNNEITIDDERILLESLGNREKYEEFQKCLDICVKDRARSLLPEIIKESKQEDTVCADFFNGILG